MEAKDWIAIVGILAHAAFEYDRFTPHTTERVFAVNPAGEKTL